MNLFAWVCLIVCSCSAHALKSVLDADLVASYEEAFEKYQVRFNKHYDSNEEYTERLYAYAVCSAFVLLFYLWFKGYHVFHCMINVQGFDGKNQRIE